MTTSPSLHRRRSVSLFVGSAVAIALLWCAPLPAPDWSSLRGAPDGSPLGPAAPDAVGLATHGARLMATVMLGYLCVAAAANLAVALCAGRVRLPPALVRAASLAPRWLTTASVGLVASSAMLTPSAAAAVTDPAPAADDPVTMEVVADPRQRTVLPWAIVPSTATPATATPATTAPPGARVAPTSTVATAAAAVTTTTSRPLPSPPLLEPSVPAPGSTASPGTDQLPPPLVMERGVDGRPTEAAPAAGFEHTVQPGEHFWSIATRVVADRQLTVPVAGYWRLLVEVNRDRLVDPDDPDLLYPGQVLVLP